MVTEFNKFNEDEFLRMKRRQKIFAKPNLHLSKPCKMPSPGANQKKSFWFPTHLVGRMRLIIVIFAIYSKVCRGAKLIFNLLYEKYSQFPYLTDSGWFFYLPAFLSFFNDLTASDLDLFERFVEKICDSDFILKNQDRELTIEQSKLVAIFLTNTANFSTNSYASQLAQDSITSHWGTYLMV